jgi:hypothetical protein
VSLVPFCDAVKCCAGYAAVAYIKERFHWFLVSCLTSEALASMCEAGNWFYIWKLPPSYRRPPNINKHFDSSSESINTQVAEHQKLSFRQWNTILMLWPGIKNHGVILNAIVLRIALRVLLSWTSDYLSYWLPLNNALLFIVSTNSIVIFAEIRTLHET